MRITLALVAALLVVGLAACGNDRSAHVADPGGSSMPTKIPAAAGTVATRDLVTVMDTGAPELCLGAVAESYPPQCRGLQLSGWSWADQHGVFEHQGDIRWGLFQVTGTFDGTTFTVQHAIPAALYDAMPQGPGIGDCAEGEGTDCMTSATPALEQIQTELTDLPGLLTSWASKTRVHADVVFDDGTLQAWADETYGAGVVAISSALVAAG